MLEALCEIAYASIVVFFEYFVLRIHFVQFVSQCSTNYISHNLFKRLFVWVFVLGRIVFSGTSFVVGFLAHHPDAFISRFYRYWLNVTDRDAVDSSLVLPNLILFRLIFQLLLLSLVGEKSGLLSLVKIYFVALIFSFGNVVSRNVNSSVSQTQLVCYSLDFFLLHLLSDRRAQVFWLVLLLFILLLLLYFR